VQTFSLRYHIFGETNLCAQQTLTIRKYFGEHESYFLNKVRNNCLFDIPGIRVFASTEQRHKVTGNE